jgi:hypothetical protein
VRQKNRQIAPGSPEEVGEDPRVCPRRAVASPSSR